MFCKRKGFCFFSSMCNIKKLTQSAVKCFIARVHDPFRVRVLLLSHFIARFFNAFIYRLYSPQNLCRLQRYASTVNLAGYMARVALGNIYARDALKRGKESVAVHFTHIGRTAIRKQ